MWLAASLVLATTYSVRLPGSITGVPVMPISGVMSQHSPVSPLGTVVMPAARVDEADSPERASLRASASNA